MRVMRQSPDPLARMHTMTKRPAREAAGNQRPWPADKVERWSIDRRCTARKVLRSAEQEPVVPPLRGRAA